MKEWRFEDKSTWGEGPWQDEPDKTQWQAHGFDCLIRRGPSGALCGYVGVPESHPLFKKDYCDLYDYDTEKGHDLDVHGGLTFSDLCQPGEPEHGICHTKEDAINDLVWWLGFDCAHAWDVTPASDARLRERGYHASRFGDEVYRSIGYVQAETENLARQLRAITQEPGA